MKVTDVINSMEYTNVCTFGTIGEERKIIQEVEVDGETFWVKPFSCYNFKATIDGKNVCLNPMCYDGDLDTIEFPMDWETGKSAEFWLFFNFTKALIYENVTGEWVGEITEVLDVRNVQDRLQDMRERGEI